MILAEIVFWLAAFLIAYTYLLYPILLFALSAGSRCGATSPRCAPAATGRISVAASCLR